jgi:hypothetical protein
MKRKLKKAQCFCFFLMFIISINLSNAQVSSYSLELNSATTNTCGVGRICVKYTLPTANNTIGSINISLDVYQNGIKLRSITSGVVTNGTSYCFMNLPSSGLNYSLGGFDYILTGNFTLSGFNLSPIVVGSPSNGQVSGANNDYLFVCATGNVYYSKPSGDLHNVLTWGLNTNGSGANPSDFGAGKTFNLANRSSLSYGLTGDWIVGGIINAQDCGSTLSISGYTLSASSIRGLGCVISSYLLGSPTSNLIITGDIQGQEDFIFASASSRRVLILDNLTIDRTGYSASVIFRNPVEINGVLTVKNGNFTTSIQDNFPPNQSGITLKSKATNTARVAPIPSTASISGSVTVERYIPARRAWRILAAPVSSSVQYQTINQAWQEGVTTSSVNSNPYPGFGTHITEGSPANGFDQNPFVAMVSAKRYISTINSWVNLTNTNTTDVNTDAYMIFVRGDRGVKLGSNSVPATATTLRCKGGLKQGNQTFFVSPTGFTAIPNPFASPINFATITRNNVSNNFSLWDPKAGGINGVGAYVTVSFNGSTYDVSSNAISPESQFIQSGQGFLVTTITSGVAGSLTIKESDKSSTAATDVFRVAGDGDSDNNPPVFADPTQGNGLRLQLQTSNTDGTTAVLDEVFASYKSNYSNKIDEFDAAKATNMAENLGIKRDAYTLAIERRTLPTEDDVIDLQIWNTERKSYILQFNPVNLSGTGLFAYLEDKYLKTSTAVSLGKISKIHFDITNDAASARTDRFRIMFTKSNKPETGITKGTITVYPNPIVSRNISLQFTAQPAGTYLVTIVNSFGGVVLERNIQHYGGAAIKNLVLDKKLPIGIYNLQIKGKDSETSTKILIQ